MKFIKNSSTDPYYNLALEEYALKNFRDGDYVLLWQNDNALIIGKYQNTIEEINEQKVKELGVKVVRRNTGGGAVFHDMGNLNFSFITDWKQGQDMSHDIFLEPVIAALVELGIPAKKQGRNDIAIEGRKISGNAQTIQNNRILHHGTLLFDADLSRLASVLRVDASKIESKGVKSTKSRVANIKEYALQGITIEALKKALLDAFSKREDFAEIQLTPEQMNEVDQLRQEKYVTWEWNYGSSPCCSYKNKKRFAWGGISVGMEIEQGLIKQCKIRGDFLGVYPIEEVESKFIYAKYERGKIAEILDQIPLQMYFGQAGPEELMECFGV